jgi:hypothetical protein
MIYSICLFDNSDQCRLENLAPRQTRVFARFFGDVVDLHVFIAFLNLQIDTLKQLILLLHGQSWRVVVLQHYLTTVYNKSTPFISL